MPCRFVAAIRVNSPARKKMLPVGSFGFEDDADAIRATPAHLTAAVNAFAGDVQGEMLRDLVAFRHL